MNSVSPKHVLIVLLIGLVFPDVFMGLGDLLPGFLN